MTARRARLSEDPTDRRRHFQHGPIDLIIGADGDARAIDEAHEAAWSRFGGVLDELVGELPALKQAIAGPCRMRGPIARRMWNACLVHSERFITPMAAVAGAVADEMIAYYLRPGIDRAWVNNGGDIALHLADGASLRVGLFADLARFDGPRPGRDVDVDGRFTISHDDPIRGVATSGWRGRSFSLGIADSVTVLARTSADADAAATMIANAVNVDDARILRLPASTQKDDSDLGERLVTVDVPPLGVEAVRDALAKGRRHAEGLCAEGVIVACALVCQGQTVTTSPRDRSTMNWRADTRVGQAA